MNGTIIGFMIWGIVGCFFIILGITAFFKRRQWGYGQMLN